MAYYAGFLMAGQIPGATQLSGAPRGRGPIHGRGQLRQQHGLGCGQQAPSDFTIFQAPLTVTVNGATRT